MANTRHLYLSNKRIIGGVCGGIAERYLVDPTWVRIITIVLALLTGGIILITYLILWIILPARPTRG